MDPSRLTMALWGNGYAPENDAISFAKQKDREGARRELASALMETWPVQMAKSAVGAAALPGDVYAGRVDPMSQQGIERAADFAGLITLGSFGAPRPAGSLGMGGMPEKPVSVNNQGNGLFRVLYGDADAGTISVARDGAGDFVSAASLSEPFQGKGIGGQAYDLIEKELGRRLAPSPLGLSPNAAKFWHKRLKGMTPEERADLFARSREAGRAYGVPDRDINLRLYGIGGAESLP